MTRIANRHTELLTREEESALMIRAKKGEKAARDRLVLANYRFVINVCKQFQNQGLELEDLVSEGVIGLHRAIESFDPGLGLKFISYAVWWIRASATRAITEKGTIIRFPVNFFHRRKGKTEEVHQQQIEAIRNMRAAPSLDAMVESGMDFPHPGPRPDEVATETMNQILVDALLAKLSPLDLEIMRARYGLDTGEEQTLEQIGTSFDLTRERIRQRQKEALGSLRNAAKLLKRTKFQAAL